MKEERRIYSFNKISYILLSVPDAKYKMEFDTESNNTYFVFEDSKKVAKAIRNFSQDRCICYNLHRYLDIFSKLKKKSIKMKNAYICKLNGLDENI